MQQRCRALILRGPLAIGGFCLVLGILMVLSGHGVAIAGKNVAEGAKATVNAVADAGKKAGEGITNSTGKVKEKVTGTAGKIKRDKSKKKKKKQSSDAAENVEVV